MSADPETVRRAEQRVGTVIKGKYRVDRVLGMGGMGVVCAATHRNQKQFAVKMLHPELSVRGDIRARFLREGSAARSAPAVVEPVPAPAPPPAQAAAPPAPANTCDPPYYFDRNGTRMFKKDCL